MRLCSIRMCMELYLGLDCVYVTKDSEKSNLTLKEHTGNLLNLYIIGAQPMFITQWILNGYLLNE